MKKLTIVGALATMLVTTVAVAQGPEGRSYFEEREAAPRDAVEITVGTGYTQGFGLMQRGTAMPDVISAGIAANVGGAYRIDPRFAVGLEGEYQEFSRGSNLESSASARGLAGDVFGAFHFSPYQRFDPWVRLGTGYRMLWTVHTNMPNALTHGLQLARIAIGADVRTTADVAIAPLIGADLNLFLWDRQEGGTNVAITDPRLSTFVYAGLQGRFDLGGARETEGMVAQRGGALSRR